MSAESFAKLLALKNQSLMDTVEKYIQLCAPASVFVSDDSDADRAYIRQQACQQGSEIELAIEGHTVHFDGITDQGRDKNNTRYFVDQNSALGQNLNTIDRQQGMTEISEYLRNSMQGKTVYISFFCLGPNNSEFSISCLQITDSAYIIHSENLLYRRGYEQFKSLKGSKNYFRFVHAAGHLEQGVSAKIDQRRIYIDLDQDIVFSTNTQYAGNTIGLKKLAMRLAINKSKKEGWLTEHTFIMGINGPGGRRTYFAGAFPSACGKTSTAMMPGESILGDDIAYIRECDGQAFAVNVEAGIFGIISDVSEASDSKIWAALNSPGEVIFSNILISPEKSPFWLGMGIQTPTRGFNFAGPWQAGQCDSNGKEIPLAHKNARYTIALNSLANCDQNLDNPHGVPLGGMVYGGRDSDTSVPIVEAFNHEHGVLMIGATIESETTAATLGQEGVRKFNLMSILDFLSYPLGEYIMHNIEFGRKLSQDLKVFGVNYFLRNADGKYLNGMQDKHIWLKWSELRVHNEVEAIKTPIGYIPYYEDLKRLFKEVLQFEFTPEMYVQQFTLRIPQLLAKLERITNIYKQKVSDAPPKLFDELAAQKARLETLKAEKGEYVSPFSLTS